MTFEWIVQVDSEDGVVGKIDRSVAHDNKNLILHREVMIILFTDKSHRQFLLQHRSLTKKQLPGYWTLSVTGHVDFNDLSESDPEGYLTAAKRETMEEIGVKATNLKLVGKEIQKNNENFSMMGIVIGEYKGEIKLDLDEVSEVKIFEVDTLVQVSDKLTPGARACLKYLKLLI